MSYILTVLSNGNLEHINLFAGWTAAFESAKSWAEALVSKSESIDTTPEQEFGQGYQVWRFVETNKIQVSVWFIQASTVASSAPSYVLAKALINNLPPVMRPHPMPKIWKSAVPQTFLPIESVKPIPPEDDPLADHLPCGWSWSDRPMTIAEAKQDPMAVKTRDSMTETQEWALALARVSKRPSCLFLIKPGMYPATDRPGLYSQKYALEELKNKTMVGVIIRNQELEHLVSWLGDGQESEDPQMMDGNEWDESSSDSFDHH